MDRRKILWLLRDLLEDTRLNGFGLEPNQASTIANFLIQDARRESIIRLLQAWEYAPREAPE